MNEAFLFSRSECENSKFNGFNFVGFYVQNVIYWYHRKMYKMCLEDVEFLVNMI